MSELCSDTLRTIWIQLAARNEWLLVDDETAFLRDASAEWHRLVNVRIPGARYQMAIQRTYGALLYDGLCRRLGRAFYELGRAFARAMLRPSASQDVAEELAQEAILRVLENLQALRSPQSLFSWAFKILYTVARESRHAGCLEQPFATNEHGAATWEPVDPHDLVAEAEERIMEAKLLALLRTALPNERERLLVLRTVILDDKPRDVARALGVPLHQARLAKSRGLKHLREHPTFLQQLQDLLGEDLS